MSKGDRFGLISIFVLIVIGFALFYVSVSYLGMSAFGWFMGAMMFLAPLVSLWGMAMDKNHPDKIAGRE